MMSRRFGIAGVQMGPVAWEPEATVAKMADVVAQIRSNFPWVEMVLFPELVVSGVAPFVSSPKPEIRRQSAQPIPGPLTDRLCAIARAACLWLLPGSMEELEGRC